MTIQDMDQHEALWRLMGAGDEAIFARIAAHIDAGGTLLDLTSLSSLVGTWASDPSFKLQNWRFGVRPRVVVCVCGDSITEAIGAGSPGTPEQQGFAFLLQQALQREFGDGGRGFYGLWKSQWSKTGTWVNVSNLSPFGAAWRNNAGDATPVYTLTGVVGDNVDILYVDNNVAGVGVGNFNVSVDGGAPIACTQATLNDLKTKAVNVSLGSLGTHTIAISGASAGYLILVGAAVYKGTSGAVVHNIGRSGYSAWGMTGGAQDGGGTGNNGLMLNLLDTLRPDLTLIEFGTNEYVWTQPVATYGSALAFIANRAKIAGRTVPGDINGDVLFVMSPESSYSGPSPVPGLPFSSYVTQLKATAASSGVPYASIRDNWGTWAQANAAGRMADVSHPNNKGHQDMAGLIWRMLRLA